MVTIAPRLTPHKSTTTQVKTMKKDLNPQEKTQCRAHSHPIHSRPGGEHQECVCQVWDQNTLQRQQDLKTNASQTQGRGPKGKEEQCHIQLSVWSHQLLRGIYRGNDTSFLYIAIRMLYYGKFYVFGNMLLQLLFDVVSTSLAVWLQVRRFLL